MIPIVDEIEGYQSGGTLSVLRPGSRRRRRSGDGVVRSTVHPEVLALHLVHPFETP